MDYYNQETDRLLFRKLENSDIESWCAFFENNPLEKYVGIDTSLPTITKASNWINLQLRRYKKGNYGHLAVIDKQTEKLIGVGGLIQREVDSIAELEIAYSIIPQYWGKGFATETAKKLKDFAFSCKLKESLISIISIQNKASENVAIKNGMSIQKPWTYHGMEVNIYRVKNTY